MTIIKNKNMKRNFLKYIILMGILGNMFTSCDDYLDANELNDQLTIEEVFRSENDALRFLADVYRFMRNETGWSNQSPWTGISDELDVTYQDYGTAKINTGSMLPGSPDFDYWSWYYSGIRNATYFIQHVDDIEFWREDVEETVQNRKERYKTEARALRAFYYFCIFRQYGPTILMHDDIIPSDATIDEISIPRSSVAETVAFIESELDAVIASKKLPQSRENQRAMDYGRITEATCMAVKSRLLLYAASDFYNKDINPMQEFATFQNKDGKLLFDYTNETRIQRWQKAADAAKEVIDLQLFSLYKETGGAPHINAYNSYRNLFQTEWNNEIIFGRRSGGFNEMDQASTPRMVGTNAWSGWGPTQQIVDAYFTKNGLPIDKDPTYNETGFSTTANEDYGYLRNTFNMYVDREPRFYASITFNNSKWIADNNKNTIQFYMGGNSGYHEKTNARNFSRTGYLAKKFVSPKSNVASGSYVNRNYIHFRLGEIYLNYAEALNEIGFEANKTEILYYINQIRERAGIPLYGDGAGMISVSANDMRELIRAERRVELAFESHRYFDCKRWIIAHQTDGGDFWGMDVYAGEDGFHKRTVFERRSFQTKNYLWPIKTSETYKNALLVQNPGWSAL